MAEEPNPILIYDGECRLCTKAVKFLSTEETSGKFNLIPSKDTVTGSLLEKYGVPNDLTNKTVIMIRNNRIYTKSSAIIRALQMKGGMWKLTGIFLLIPAFIRNLIYDWIAANRNKIIE